MMRRALGRLVAAALAVGVWSIVSRSSVGEGPSPAADPPPAASPGPQWQGVASCAATGCHGGNGPRASKGSEYTTWVAYDPHARAHTVLSEERSRRMIEALRDPQALPAERNVLCIKCHVHPSAAAVPAPARLRLVDGVACENCHGPAEKWRSPHARPDWKAKSKEEKIALGMQPLKDLLDRAKACVPCHVGSAAADVNHDLIAAGHPRLNFELASY